MIHHYSISRSIGHRLIYDGDQALFLLNVYDRYLRDQLLFFRVPYKEQGLLAQAIRTKAFDHLLGHSYFSQGIFIAWYRQVITAVIMDHFRTGQRDSSSTSASGLSNKKLSLRDIWSLLSADDPLFNPEQLLVLRMRYWERKNFKLISGELSWPYDTVVGRYRQVVRTLPFEPSLLPQES